MFERNAWELNSYLGARRQGCRTTQPYAVEPMILIGGLQQNAFCQKNTFWDFNSLGRSIKDEYLLMKKWWPLKGITFFHPLSL